MKKMTKEEFIEKANIIHNFILDYSLFEYIDSRTKGKIICHIHGVFEQKPSDHLSGHGCPKCGNLKKGQSKILIKEDYIIKANIVHDFKYDYSLFEYIDSRTKVKISCPIHGIFEQKPSVHLSGRGCPKCVIKNKIPRTPIILITTNDFNKKANIIHNFKYDYSLFEYNGSKIKGKIICHIHGVFEQKPSDHLSGRGCPKCGLRNKTTIDFNKKANIIHNFIYDYSLVDYKKCNVKVKIICHIHGVFEQTPNDHLSGRGCPKCNSSKGELIIENYLKENNMLFISQKRFNDCRNSKPLPFDFYLSDYNICIEYDGIQHHKIIQRWGGYNGFESTKIKDEIKTNYCLDNNIKLIRIPYWEKDNIEDILNKELNITPLLVKQTFEPL